MNDKNPFRIGQNLEDSDSLLRGKYRQSWVENSLEIEGGITPLSISHTKNFLGSSLKPKRVQIFLIILVLGLAIILARVFYLQIFKGPYYREIAEGNRIRLQPISAERGIIYDRAGKELVKNIPSFSLVVVPQDLPRTGEQRTSIIAKIASSSHVAVEEINTILKKYGSYGLDMITLKENLDYQTALSLYIQNADLPGVHIQSGSKREYLSPSVNNQKNTLSLSHLLGYLGKINSEEQEKMIPLGYFLSDNIGKAGLEKYYEEVLRGKTGRKKVEVNALGKEQNILAVDPPMPGKNLILSIDLEGQKKLEDLISNYAARSVNKKIAAVALNPQNGQIISMVSWPAFNNNDFSGGISQEQYKKYLSDKNLPLFNRVIAGTYPPGSTAKLMVAAAALQENIINISTSVNSVGGIEVGGKLFKDWKAGGHGYTNVVKAIAWSVNTYFYYVGGGYKNFAGLGFEKIIKYFVSFGVGQKTNIDLPGEYSGTTPSKEEKLKQGTRWYVGDTYNLSIGQGDLLVTPLQAAIWTAAVANDGYLVQPHLGYKTTSSTFNQATELKFLKTKIDNISSNNLKIVRQGMRECVVSGSCKLLNALPFLAAGKTGTAQWNANRPTHAWFTSFAPYQNPQIVVTILVEEGGEGSVAAMPIAKDYLLWWGAKYLKALD